MSENVLKQLLEKHLEGELSDAEAAELKNIILQVDGKDHLSVELHEMMNNLTDELTDDNPEWENRIAKIVSVDKTNKTSKVIYRIHFLRTGFLKYAAAILIIFGTSVYLWNTNRYKKSLIEESAKSDIAAPVVTKSSITLASGKTIFLDSVSEGIIAVEGKITIEKLKDGNIVYRGLNNDQVIYNTITVPRGSKIASLTLSDGTIVFLNTASTLKYPVAFSKNNRSVEITGEAYFEVAKDAKRKFVVRAGNIITEVLGTHFNISSYDNELTKNITLLEGKIRVAKDAENIMLEPGQQVQAGNKLNLQSGVDIGNVMAWKNGKFRFSDANIEEVMKQLERWYNVKVEYQQKPLKKFDGGIPRSLSLLSVLKVLETTGGVKFKIEGNKVIVMK